jgi:hypothetical protein
MIIKKILFILLLIAGFTALSAATAHAVCTSTGSAFVVMSTNNYTAGKTQVTTMTFTATLGGISSGTVLAMRVPDFWGMPYVSGNGYMYVDNSDFYYGIRYSTSGAGFNAPLTVTTSGQFVIIAVANDITAGQSVLLYYAASTCQLGSAVFRTYNQEPGCTSVNQISTYTRTVLPGNASFIGFEGTQLLPLVNTIVPVRLEARDNCGNKVQAGLTIPVFLTTQEDSGYGPMLDPDALISTSTSFLSAASAKAITLAPTSTGATFYYRITTFATTNYYAIRATYPVSGYDNQSSLYVRPVTGGITGVSVDTGTFGTLSSVTITPDGNGVSDFAYINFMTSEDFGWEVSFSSDNFNSFAKRIYGYGRNGRITWDGSLDNFGPQGVAIAPAGTYKVRILVGGGGGLKDESLTVILSVNELKGRVQESGTLTDIAGANIDVFGPTSRFAQTAVDGQFKVSGLQPGSYNLRISKPGYGTKEFPVTVVVGQTDVGTKTLDKVSLLQVNMTRPSDVFLPEVWGNVRARTNDWSSQFYGSIHFIYGSTVSDAGDNYNAILSSYTSISLLPNTTYQLELNMPGFNINPTTFIVGSGVIVSTTIALQRRPNIFGTVSIPVPADYPTWVSVEAGIDADENGQYDSSGPDSRFYGGTTINAGTTTATYSVFGVVNGKYLLKAQTPGYARASATVTVSGSIDAQKDFPTFGSGGVLVGTITINGDTNSLDYDHDGDIDINLNAWSPVNFEGSNTQITVAIANITMATYTISGLSNGIYEVGMWLNGFEASPPGPKTGTVVGGIGTLDLTFNKYSGVLSGAVSLKDSATDYANVVLEITPLRNYGPATANVFLSSQSPDSSGNYAFTGLGTDFYTLRARYSTTGLLVEYGVQVVNGSTTTRNVDLTAQTYSISGRVTTSASAPFNDLSYIVNNTTFTDLNSINGPSLNWPANRIVAIKKNNRDSNNQNMGGMVNAIDPAVTYYGTYDASNGTYTINNLSPGTYELSNNGEMDNTTTNGPEIAVEKRTVNILGASLTGQDFILSDGYSISGELKIESGDVETGRNFQIVLKNAKKENVVSENVFLNGTSIAFTLRRVPAGTYVLTAVENMTPIKYSVKDVPVDVAANLTGKDISLLKAAKIQGQLRVKNTGSLISNLNYSQLLPSNFFIEARSNPWFPGGFAHSNYPLIGADGLFSLYANPGTYDVLFKSDGFVGTAAISEGKKQFVPVTLSGIEVTAGQIKDLGVIDLVEGIRVTGTVTDKNNLPLPNIAVEARRSGQRNHEDPLRAYTDIQGQYVIYGIDSENTRYYDIVAAPRPDTHDERYQFGFDGIQYGEVRKTQVDTQVTTSVNFKIEPALGSVRGIAVTPDGGALTVPFGDEGGAGAYVIMNKQGNVPQNNPLGDIEVQTNANGDFLVKGLAAGIYDLWILANGYGSANITEISVGNSQVDLGTVTLVSGYKLSGTLLKSDGSAPSAQDLDVILGVRNGFQEILVGRMTEDASGNVSDYEISGFQSGKTYSVILMYEHGDINVLAPSITLTADTEQNFVISDATPTAITQVSRDTTTGLMTIQFELSRALRNSQVDLDNNSEADDSEQAKLVTLSEGAGTLSFPESWLSSDRKRIIVNYLPAAGETTFKLRFRGTFVSQNTDTGQNHTLDRTFTFFNGIGRQKTSRVSNASGGSVQMENDTSEISLPSGTFGDDADLQVEVTMSAADTADTLGSQLDISRAAGRGAMSRFSTLGAKAYPGGMARAMGKLKAQAINPFASFYDIFLPAGVSHAFPEGKEATMCLNYDSTVSDVDAYSLNVYYFNELSDEYILEDTEKSVDTENKRICVSLGHASIFTILQSSASIITGAGYTGPLAMINFPNPFNLKPKTVTLQDPGTASANQTIDGTMIKISAPVGVGGALKLEIFSVTGELVRKIEGTITAGAHTYVEWDGKNDEGQDVASGVYVVRMTIAGGNERFLKLAVVK